MKQKPGKRPQVIRSPKSVHDMSLPKYSIAVASELSGVAQQQLRRMEESGLLTPERTAGNTRRYSDDDLAQINEVATLAEQGVNMEGIRRILLLQEEIRTLQAEIEDLQAKLAAKRE